MENTLKQVIRQVLKPLVQILHQQGVAVGEIIQLLKEVYVDVSAEALARHGERPTTSRIAIASGLTRKEVAQLRQASATLPEMSNHRYNRGARVITGWLTDNLFLTADGTPATLPLQGSIGSFATLVSRYSGDIPSRAMLQELLRVGAVQLDAAGQVQLLSAGYIPHDDMNEKFAILGTDVAALVNTIAHNLATKDREQLFFQRKVCYDNLPEEALPAFKSLVTTDGLALLVKFNEYLSQQDRDSNPHITGTGRMRAGVGIYYFEESVAAQPRNEDRDET